jgi:hypothetical protein
MTTASQYEKAGQHLQGSPAEAAFAHNAELLRDLASDLEPRLNPRLVAAAHHNGPGIAYATNFRYLRRDWGGSEAAEVELRSLHQVLRYLTAEYKINHAESPRVSWRPVGLS